MMSGMDITLRTARPAEYPAVGELVAAAYLDDGLLTYGTEDPYLDILRDTAGRARQAELMVAVDAGGTLLGTVTFAAEPPYAQIAAADEAEFRMLAVAPAARGRGAGELLVRDCLRRTAELGRRRLVLSTSSAMHTAHRLYQRLGFRRAPERDWDPIEGVSLMVFTGEAPG
jgi:ribosomal protein S18 acetylase RimI-like enzyme